MSRTLHARLTVGRGVRQWQRAFQRDGRHCPRVKPARGFAPCGARRACTHVRMHVHAEVRTRRKHTRVHFSHIRGKPANVHHRVRTGRPHDKCIRDGRRASNKRRGPGGGWQAPAAVHACATASHMSGKGSADGQPRN